MPHLFRSDTGQPIAEVSEEELQRLAAALEEESSDDTDYFIDGDTLMYLEEEGLDESLLTLLHAAVGDGGVEVRWSL